MQLPLALSKMKSYRLNCHGNKFQREDIRICISQTVIQKSCKKSSENISNMLEINIHNFKL